MDSCSSIVIRSSPVGNPYEKPLHKLSLFNLNGTADGNQALKEQNVVLIHTEEHLQERIFNTHQRDCCCSENTTSKAIIAANAVHRGHVTRLSQGSRVDTVTLTVHTSIPKNYNAAGGLCVLCFTSGASVQYQWLWLWMVRLLCSWSVITDLQLMFAFFFSRFSQINHAVTMILLFLITPSSPLDVIQGLQNCPILTFFSPVCVEAPT